MIAIEIGGTYVLDYTNYKGERSERAVRILAVEFGRNDYHPEPGLILRGVDVARGVERTFATDAKSRIHDVRAAPAG